MLEGAVARLLNQVLGKYVVDLDLENLNVGIFSGKVQLTDLKLNPEALFELDLPIQVKVGTIGKIELQIPWSSLWNSPTIINIEDIHIIATPIISNKQPFDSDVNKRLIRAKKRKVLSDLDTEGNFIGGPDFFSEALVASVINNLQISISNVHIRYEDSVSNFGKNIAAGMCIGNITAESTNSKWKPSKDNNSDTSFYLVKIEAVSTYWNCDTEYKEWDMPSQYYPWRNAMSASLQNFSMNEEQFDFLLKPMTAKMKITMKKTKNQVDKLLSELVIHDCNIHISKTQYESILTVIDALNRMLIKKNFVSILPNVEVKENSKIWWKYAYSAVLEQRVRPYTWQRIKKTRTFYRNYLDTYKQIILNPNDTELKLDLQQHEDNLDIVNIVIARQQARLLLKSRSIGEKSFWSMLPSPEKLLLCEKIGYSEKFKEIDRKYLFQIGNINVSLLNDSKEILVLTLTQAGLTLKPNNKDASFNVSFKVEGFIVEGATNEDTLVPIISSEHLCNSPAYFFKAEFEKMPIGSKSSHKLNVALDSVECVYHKESLNEIEKFFETTYFSKTTLENHLPVVISDMEKYVNRKLLDTWELNLNLKIPFFVIPDTGSILRADNILVLDFGRYFVTTEICEHTEIEHATQMELEEQLYSKLHIECSDIQVLFCDSSDNWRDARKENDTELHILPRTSFTSIYAYCVNNLQTIPTFKFNINIQCLKINASEKQVGLFLKYFNRIPSINVKDNHFINDDPVFLHDFVEYNASFKYLLEVQSKVSIDDGFGKTKRGKSEKTGKKLLNGERHHLNDKTQRKNMNEAYARIVDLPGLEDNISPTNNIRIMYRFVINELLVVYSKSSDSTDRQYLNLRVGVLAIDMALMTYGPAYQLTVNSILLTDKMHNTSSGQYLDLVYSPLPSTTDVVTVLYRKVSASCPDFWTHFHGVETSLVTDFGTIYVLLHQEVIHTFIKYSKYMKTKLKAQVPQNLMDLSYTYFNSIRNKLNRKSETPVPPGSVKFSHSARLMDLDIRVCDSDFDIVNIQLSGLEVDFLFRANERFVFRSFLSNIEVEHLSEVTLYSKVFSTDKDKVFEVKYVRHASVLKNDISPNKEDNLSNGCFKFQLGQIHITFLYKLFVQLQRFIINLEALPTILKCYSYLKQVANTATNTLKSNPRINLVINMCGPIFLFPQKSSSPNVIIIDTGSFHVENLFKENPTEFIENIMIKWQKITLSRGVMTMAQTLEMQESLIDPIQINMDIKRSTSLKTLQKLWDIDGLIENIEINLGQKDLAVILLIYNDNISEGKIIDIFPNPLKSPDVAEQDEIVKSLEAFFCEPKQKNILIKFVIENVKVMFFFDSGELLSSPIRDLSHGLCLIDIVDINASMVIYTDKTGDGKMSVDQVLVEEIGPDANSLMKRILYSPMDENKNNNCHITINKPPIFDITFHQTKNGDISIDFIVGRLSLNLSIPFCEKLAVFILECLPKDNFETGCINFGYEGETQVAQNNLYQKSLTISFRINKPEFTFLVQSTSNKSRYFITKAEILADYSRHGHRLNFVLSLSGLHNLFYDSSQTHLNPYVILRPCDIEFSHSFSLEKGTKASISISSFYIQICSEVVHSLNDILNDIAEHFKLPVEAEVARRKSSQIREMEEIWEPKKMRDYIAIAGTDSQNEFNVELKTNHEVFIIPKFEVVVIFELEQMQVLLFKLTMEVTVYDWSTLLNSTSDISIQGNYFSEQTQKWEPLIDPVTIGEQEYKPWEVNLKVFQDKGLPMVHIPNGDKTKVKTGKEKTRKTRHSYTTTEDEDSGEDMMYLEPNNSIHSRGNRRVKTSLSTFLDDSDSENEDCAMEKLAAAISDLFTGDWNESEDSDCAHSSEGEADSDENYKKQEQTPPQNFNFPKSTYILLDSKETLNLTITPSFLKLLNELLTIYSSKTLFITGNSKSISLTNDIGPNSKVELFEKGQNDQDDVLIMVKTYENQESCPNSPTKNTMENNMDENNDKEKMDEEESFKLDAEINYDHKTINSLQFPVETTGELFEKVNHNYAKIQVADFAPMQTNCSNSNWSKMLKLRSKDSKQIYYLGAKHTVNKNGRKLAVSSPLQIKNETCFPLSVLYQPSVLQQLNLEPIGEIINPFETTMRIAVLDAYESYNVPLYVAYYCKLFIQPAYAEGNYVCNSGIWWSDLTNELDTAHNFICTPKSNSNLDSFSLRVVLKKNFDSKTSQVKNIPNYIIYLLPPLVVQNYLPFSLEIESLATKLIKIEAGEKCSVYTLDLTKDQKLQVKMKQNMNTWTGVLNLTTHLDDKIVILTSDSNEKSIAINAKLERSGSCSLYFYASYWIVNKTTLPLKIKASASNSLHESTTDEILLFTYKRHGKQTLNVQVYDSNWSNEFGLECAETTGLIVCKDSERKKKYLFFMNAALSELCPRLTKIITILPSFVVQNQTNKSLRIMEHNEKTDLWLDVLPFKSVVFWPETSSMQMYLKYRDSKIISQAFNISTCHKTVLRMDKGGAITITVTGGISDSFKIIFTEYKHGDAPVLIKNYCADLFLKIQQQDQSPVTLLNPYNSLIYTWDDPCRPRLLVWNIYNNKESGYPVDIFTDGFGEEKIKFRTITPTTNQSISSSEESDSSDSVQPNDIRKVRRDKVTIYWACFRNGVQRTLLFTQELRIYNDILNTHFLIPCEIDALISLNGIGLSIFTNDSSNKEHLYASLADMPAIWEVNVGHKWKTLTLELASWIEEKYKLQTKKCQLKDYIHIDFEKMFMLKPFFAELRRTYVPAMYAHFRKTKRDQYFNLKLHSLQIDNKSTNTIVLRQLPYCENTKGKPFLDFALSRMPLKNVSVYKYVRLTILNFAANIENDLIYDLGQLIYENKKFFGDSTAPLVNDMNKIHSSITKMKEDLSEKSIIENVFVSGFGIQLNICNRAHIGVNKRNIHFSKILNLLFPINISPYMPLEGVYHKISSVEQIHIYCDLTEAIVDTTNQIQMQFLQQYYSHVLGLQVLVNTFAIQPSTPMPNLCEPEKMANILLNGSRCLLGHINMSPAALEQSILDLFTNQSHENILRIGRHGSYHNTEEIIPKCVTASCKNFNIGVPNALSQLIVKNHLNGISNEGEMFFRTTGKALLSLMTRHPDEKSDSVEIARDALRRASILGEPIKMHLRLTRYRNKHLGLKPMSVYESIGHHLLETIANGQFANDTYWAHSTVDKIGKSILVVSLEHVIRINKCRIWGPWEIEWSMDLDDIISMPKMVSSELIFNKRPGEVNSEETLKILGDKEMLMWIHAKMEQAIIVSMEEKSWTLTVDP